VAEVHTASMLRVQIASNYNSINRHVTVTVINLAFDRDKVNREMHGVRQHKKAGFVNACLMSAVWV